jgi:hypothetical protein
MQKNRSLDAVTYELRAAGISYQIEQGKHLKIKWSMNGRNETYVVPRSSGDHRGHKNARAEIRRKLRELNNFAVSYPRI